MDQTLSRPFQQIQRILQENIKVNSLLNGATFTMVLDSDSNVLEMNKEFLRLLSIADFKPGSTNICEFLCGNSCPESGNCELISALHTKIEINQKVFLPQINKFLKYRILPLFSSEGNNKSVLIFEDITEQVWREEQLIKESESILRDISGNIQDVIFIWDGKNFVFLSPYISKIFGISPETIYKNPDTFFAIFEDNDRDLLKEYFYYQPTESFSHTFKYSDDENSKWFMISMKSEASIKGLESQKITGIIQNITQIKEAENELIAAKEQAEESDRLKTSFLANISHEIRTPLNGIVGFTQLITSTDLPPDKKKKYFDLIDLSTNQLLTIIDDILDISKLDSGQFELSEEDFYLNDVIADLESVFIKERIQRHKEHIDILVRRGLPDHEALIHADKQRLRQVIFNLVNNGLKFTDEGYVAFGYEKQGDTLLFTIEDSGIGIQKSKHNIIFDRFRQEDESFTRKYGGTGLGLSISKSIVEYMNGKIWLESETGEGARFYFTIPYKPVIKNEQKLSFSDQIINNLPVILVVDDVQLSFELVKEILSGEELELDYAYNGRVAVDKVREKGNYSMVLMDIQMPEMDGLQATKLIKETHPDLPVVAFSAHVYESDKEKACNAGCSDYLTKPFKREELLNLINKYTTEG